MSKIKTKTVYTLVDENKDSVKASFCLTIEGNKKVWLEKQENVYVFTKEQLEERDRERDQKIIEAWQALEGDRQYTPKQVQHWLLTNMKSAIDFLRNRIKTN